MRLRFCSCRCQSGKTDSLSLINKEPWTGSAVQYSTLYSTLCTRQLLSRQNKTRLYVLRKKEYGQEEEEEEEDDK